METSKDYRTLKRAVFNIQLGNFSSGKSELQTLLPDSTLPSQIEIPDQFSLAGNFNGRINDFRSTASLKSSFGNADVTASLKQLGTDTNYAYDISVKTDHFDLGRLLNNDSTFGVLSATASAKGEGFDVKTMKTNVTRTFKMLFLINTITRICRLTEALIMAHSTEPFAWPIRISILISTD